VKKIFITTVVALGLSACSGGTTTIIREVPASTTTEALTQEPAQENASRVERWSLRKAVDYVRQNAPSTRAYSDETIADLMGTACDSIDTWAPDYEGYLNQAASVLSKESTADRNDLVTIIIGGLHAYCPYHQEGVLDALGETGGSSAF
jgi:uncharacterized membrane protein